MAAKTLEEHLKQALFVTRIEELAFAFGWNAAMNNLEGVQTQTNNIASMTCNCVVKRTEVAGMGIIYARSDCPSHGQFHGTHC